MKLQLVSDLHLEFCPIELHNAGADVLVLSGDIFVADYFNRGTNSPYNATAAEWRIWLENLASEFKHVVYVLGNHEHYKGNFYETAGILRRNLGHIPNLYILDCGMDKLDESTTEIEGFTFVGGTLWTDFDRDNLKALHVQSALNDYQIVQGKNYRKLTPAETVVYHDSMKHRIDLATKWSDKVVVIGHHAPSYNSIAAEYRSVSWELSNPGYASRLDSFIEKRPEIKLWTHGHVHSSHDYMIGEARVVANPRGYQRGPSLPCENRSFDPNLILEI